MARTPPDPDSFVLELVEKNPNMLVPHWLIASYQYYIEHVPVLADATFDTLVRLLGEKWDQVEHRHKALIDVRLLKTGFYLAEHHYPEIVKGSASMFRQEFASRRRSKRRTKSQAA